MSLEADIYKLLTTTFAGQSAPAFTTRVYPVVTTEDVTYPCAMYELNASDFRESSDGDSGIDMHDYTVVVMSRQMQEAEIETELIRTNLHGFRGTSIINGSIITALDNNIRGIFVDGGPSYFNNETKTYSRELELEIHVKRP